MILKRNRLITIQREDYVTAAEIEFHWLLAPIVSNTNAARLSQVCGAPACLPACATFCQLPVSINCCAERIAPGVSIYVHNSTPGQSPILSRSWQGFVSTQQPIAAASKMRFVMSPCDQLSAIFVRL